MADALALHLHRFASQAARAAGVARSEVPDELENVHRVLLATDLSAASERATGIAIALAAERHASLLVFSVVDPRVLQMAGGIVLRRVDQERARLLSGTQLVVARAREAGVTATFLVWEGDPAEMIVTASESEGADVIVIGSRGRGRIGRLLLGSTSARVKEAARCPVLVVAS